jgi:signal transduction histidine kinase
MERGMKLGMVIRRNPLLLALAAGAAAVMLFISEGSYFRSVSTLNALGAMATARSSLQGLERSFVDAETGQRGYLLTDRSEYLQPYANALQEIDAAFGFLQQYYADEPEALARLMLLRKVSETRLSELALTIQLHQQGRESATRDIVLTDIGKEQMESIRTLSADLLAQETRRVEQSRGDIYRTLMLSRIGIAALSGISLLALFMYLRKSLLLNLREQEQQRALQAERDRLEIEVAQRTAKLTELTHHLQTAREDERGRLARNLHDELGALLTAAKLDAARIMPRLAGSAPEARERLVHLVDTLNSSIALGRRIIEDLRPSTLSNLGLATTLEILAREFAERSGVQVHCQVQPVRLEADAELVIYRVVQEAITNISKYAKAGQVWITLASVDRQIEVSVRDDGVGFDTAVEHGSAYGLVGMRFRVESEGGTLSLRSIPGQGTTVVVRLPQNAPDPD